MNTVVSQSLATGLPVITTRHSGLPDQVLDGKNGFLVDEGDFEALAEKIIEYIEQPDLWHSFSAFGRAHVKRNYDSKILIEKQVDFYNGLIDSN